MRSDSSPLSFIASPPCEETLADLRLRIDEIDESLHQLLMERGKIIESLISAKTRQGGGSAFRPAREADMMRRLILRHKGILPLDTVESIWRVIISTFTYAQMEYAVHVDCGKYSEIMRDSARFHFGFTVPIIVHKTPLATIEAVAHSNSDLGLIGIQTPSGTGCGKGLCWWDALTGKDAPKIIARLPFVERPNHPAAYPVFVISKPLIDSPDPEITIFCFNATKIKEKIMVNLMQPYKAAILNQAQCGDTASFLVSCPQTTMAGCTDRLRIDLGPNVCFHKIGGHTEIFTKVS